MNMKKICSVLLILSMLLSLCACGKDETVPELLEPIETEDAVFTVSKGDLTSTTVLSGSVVPETESLSLEYANDAYDIAFSEGDHVNKGDVIMKLNDSLAKEIAELKYELSVTETRYDLEYDTFETEKETLEQQEKAYKAAGDTYHAELTKLQITENETEFNYSHYEAENEIADLKTEIESMEAELGESEVTAPCDGTILLLTVSEDGDTISAGETYLTIAVDGTKRLACPYVDEEDVEAMDSVKATVNGTEYDISYIPFTEEELFYLDLQSGDKTCYFTADNLDDVNYGDAVIFTMTAKVSDVLRIPTEAIYASHGTYYTDVVTDDATEKRAITVGRSNLNYTEILSGLTEGEVVFVAKDYARYSVNYETTNAYIGSIDRSKKLSGVTRSSEYLYEFTNPVPGEITEICISTFSEVAVTKGQELYKISPDISDSEWEQAKVDLKNYKKTYEEKCADYETKIAEQKTANAAITNSLEKTLAEYTLKDLEEEYADYKEKGTEEISRLTERIDNFEKWSEGEVTVYAEDDGIIESFSSLKVGDTLAEDQYICGFYGTEHFKLTFSDSDGLLRYGMKVTYQSRPETDLVEFPATVTKTSLVVSGMGNEVEVQLDDASNYLSTANSGYFVYIDSIDSVLLLPNAYVQYSDSDEDSEASTEEERRQIVPLNQDTEEDEDTSSHPFVYVYDDNHHIVKRYISIVGLYDGIVWIADGITTDDVVVMP